MTSHVVMIEGVRNAFKANQVDALLQIFKELNEKMSCQQRISDKEIFDKVGKLRKNVSAEAYIPAFFSKMGTSIVALR